MTIKDLTTRIAGFSTSQWIFCAGVFVFVVSYLVWSVWPKPAVDTKHFTETKPAVTAQKVSGPTLTVPLKVVPKSAVEKKFPEYKVAQNSVVVDTAKIPKAPNGGTTITATDTQTGETSTEFKPDPSPWLGFENQNYIGGGMEFNVDGTQKAKLYFKRDILRSKDLHLQVEIQGKCSINGIGGKCEGFVGPNLEWRF